MQSRKILSSTIILFLSFAGFIAADEKLSDQIKSKSGWVLEATASWQPRDSQAEFAFDDRLWIVGGWFDSFQAPPRDVWVSSDGRKWDMVLAEAPFLHTDLPMNITFDKKMWMLGGWYNGRLPGHSASNQVWNSTDGINWVKATGKADWTPRLAGAVVEFKGRMWLMGGTEDYYFGDNKSLKNDVWSSADGKKWRLETAAAGWSPRAYHQAAVLNGRIYVFGGGNYVPEYQGRNDVWSSADGVNWVQETGNAPWDQRLWFSSVVYRNAIWVIGGWSKPKDNFGDVWYSANGRDWKKYEAMPVWKARHEHSALVLKDRIWVLGGHARPLSSEVWSLQLPADWKP